MSEPESLTPAPQVPRPSLMEMALTFNHVALASFGGGLSAWSREVVVVEKKWMADEEFLSAVTMCRILPGANQVNLAVFVGSKFRGIPGAIAALIGLTTIPVIIVLIMGWAYFKYHDIPALKTVLHGAASAAVALTMAMAIKTGKKCLHGFPAIALFGATFMLNGYYHIPLLSVLAITGPLALLWGWPRNEKSRAQ